MATPPMYTTTAATSPVPLSGAINGNQFVAQPTQGQQGPGAGQVVNDLWQQSGGGNFTPFNTNQGSQQVENYWNQMGGGNYQAGPRSSLDALFGNLGVNQQIFDPTTQIVNNTMAGILNPSNPYIESARRAGLEQVAARGGLNSSIGAGAAQRAAIDSAMPMFQQAMGLTGQREQQTWQGRENELARALQQQGMRADATLQREQQDFQGRQSDLDRALTRTGQALSLDQAREQYNFQGTQADLDRAAQRARDALGLQSQREQLGFQGQQAGLDRVQQVNNQLLQQQLRERQTQLDFENTRALQGDRVAQENWLADQNYTRQFNGNLAMLPISNALQMSQAIMNYAMENPEVYSPEVISGLNNFFTGNMVSILQQYFPNATRNTGGNS